VCDGGVRTGTCLTDCPGGGERDLRRANELLVKKLSWNNCAPACSNYVQAFSKKEGLKSGSDFYGVDPGASAITVKYRL